MGGRIRGGSGGGGVGWMVGREQGEIGRDLGEIVKKCGEGKVCTVSKKGRVELNDI